MTLTKVVINILNGDRSGGIDLKLVAGVGSKMPMLDPHTRIQE